MVREGAGLTTVKPSVELPDGGGAEKPVVPVLVSPSRKDGDDLSVLARVPDGLQLFLTGMSVRR